MQLTQTLTQSQILRFLKTSLQSRQVGFFSPRSNVSAIDDRPDAKKIAGAEQFIRDRREGTDDP